MTDKQAGWVVVPRTVSAEQIASGLWPSQAVWDGMLAASPSYEPGDAVEVACLAYEHECEQVDGYEPDSKEAKASGRRWMRAALTAAFPELLARIEAFESDAAIGAKWRADSSLETWFPCTAQQLNELQAEVDRLRKGVV